MQDNTTSKHLNKVRTRFAPSPTGYLHIGGLRTALFAYLFAKKHQGSFILRIEDTDQARFVEGAMEKIADILQIMGLKYDEGVFVENGQVISKGDFGPYLQSERKQVYKEYAMQLVESGHAYYCFCTEERLADLRKEQQALKKPTLYDRHCRYLTKSDVEDQLRENKPFVIRQAIPEEGKTKVTDLVYGEITWENNLLDDQVLLKSDGFPTYHLAVVVDDHLMQVSHVIRGEEWLPSTPKHVLLYRSFNWDAPEFAHLPILLNSDRTKLSKRQNDVSVEDYLAKGYLPDALINFIALLGWNPKTDQEIFTREELIEKFDLDKVNKASPIFDTAKLDWINNVYIKNLSSEQLVELALPYLEKAGLIAAGAPVNKDFVSAIMQIEKERLKKFSELGERVDFFFKQPEYDAKILIWRKSDQAKTLENLKKIKSFISEIPEQEFNKSTLEEKVKAFISTEGLDNGSVLWPLRVSLSGLEASPGPFELMEVLHLGYGKNDIISRIDTAIKELE